MAVQPNRAAADADARTVVTQIVEGSSTAQRLARACGQGQIAASEEALRQKRESQPKSRQRLRISLKLCALQSFHRLIGAHRRPLSTTQERSTSPMDAPPPLAAQAASGGVCDLALTFSRQSDKRRPHEGSVVGGQALTFSHGSSSPRQLQKRQDLPRHKSFSCPGEVSADFSPQKPLAARPLCSWEAGSLSSPLPPSDEVSSTPAAKTQHASRQLLATGGASADTVTAQGVADAAAAASALASAANVSATGVDLFAVAFKVQHDSRLSARQRQVASQRAVAAALEQQQQRFRGRSRKGRLLWAAGRLFRGDSHFLFGFPIFCFLALCLSHSSVHCHELPLAAESLTACFEVAKPLLTGERSPEQQATSFCVEKHGFRCLRRLWRAISWPCHVMGALRNSVPSLWGLHRQLDSSRTYAAFAAAAEQLDAATGRKAWKRRAESRLYDAAAVRQSLTALKAARLSGNPQRLAGEIGKALQGHAQAALKEGLYSRTYLGTKDLLEELLSELRLALEDLTLHMQQQPKLRPLLQHAIVIAGCSAGAAVAAWLCTRTDDELRKELQEDYIHQTFRGLSPNSWIERFLNIFKRGYMCDTAAWVAASQKLFSDITFLEAYHRTGRCLNIAMTRADRDGEVKARSTPGPYLEVLFAALSVCSYPDATLLGGRQAGGTSRVSPQEEFTPPIAVCCSCAFPFLTLPMPLLERGQDGRLSISPPNAPETPYYHDGSLSGDIPLKSLASSYCGPLYSIVSQVNPHVFPFSGIRAHGEAGKPVSWRGAGGQWRGGFVLSGLEVFLKEHLRFLLRLIALLNVSPTLRGINAGALALQPYTGDVTVCPRRLYWRHIKLMNDQSFADVKWYVQEGRAMAFPKLHLISNRMRIEKAIDALVAVVGAADSDAVIILGLWMQYVPIGCTYKRITRQREHLQSRQHDA
ncbi:patatin-like phospholipase domain-containing protein [Cyclospora cayetanensis]|uniref:Patatin-like phospholipase domain-containing protein n=1 Tax=Cyclospora cayetanensis TaxID=88456 RepID=A0A1D3D5E3_9EIME|nr:patatin-like phospholipase domain-containing protein [Cyclospora cayetanensis]